MKSNNKRKSTNFISSPERNGGIVIEAINRKARRKEQRHAKKSKKNHLLKQLPSAHAVSEKKEKLSHSSDLNDSENKRHLGKRVKFSDAVQEKIIPGTMTPSICTSLLRSKSHQPQQKYIVDERDDSKGTRQIFSQKKYDHLNEETAAAFRKDDLEIEYLEVNLGIHKGKKKDRNKMLNREYAKNEGYGEDFGDFLDGLDDLVDRCVAQGNTSEAEVDATFNDECSTSSEQGNDQSDDSEEESDGSGSIEEIDKRKTVSNNHFDDVNIDKESNFTGDVCNDPYAHLDNQIAMDLRNDDAEIAELEKKLGISSRDSKKAKNKLKKEFAKSFCGYGEDFGDFLEDLDLLGERIDIGSADTQSRSRNCNPFKASLENENQSDDSDSVMSMVRHQHDDLNYLGNESSGSEDASDTSTQSEGETDVADHDDAFTYGPSKGEDIYGNKVECLDNKGEEPTKYIPPHLRKKIVQDSYSNGHGSIDSLDAKTHEANIEGDPKTIQLIQRSLNNCLNRLSENTLESVSKSITTLYNQYPFHDMNDCIWKNIQLACIPPHMIMSGLIPMYVAALAGVHWLGGDRIQLGGCLLEWSVKKFLDSLNRGRQGKGTKDKENDDYEIINKEASNTLLILCYMYNYGIVYCTLIYDLVRNFIDKFSEMDVESLLLVLKHCGQQLRSDDPSALKEIVLLVKDRAQSTDGFVDKDKNSADSSRVQYMVTTIIELKNNKPHKHDIALREKTTAFKKCIGRLKSSANLFSSTGTSSCLRVSLQDLLEVETKGRWWMVGASWAGHQNHHKLWGGNDAENFDHDDKKDNPTAIKKNVIQDPEQEKLIALASSQRMNTDSRRSIFCIVMASTDCNDAFEKLMRAGMIKPKAERDVIRVLIHCCGEERAFNPFYAHLIMRVCEYQPKSKFTLTLSFWDVFKQLNSFNHRKIANLAKLMAKLFVGSGKEKYLSLGVLKRIEFSPTEMPHQVVLFLTIFMTFVFESCSETIRIQEKFSEGVETSGGKSNNKSGISDSDDEDEREQSLKASKKEDLSDLRESIAVFLLQYLKLSPKNVNGSMYQRNLFAAIEACEKNL